MHSQISGTVDFREANDEACLARIRALVDKMGARGRVPSISKEARAAPLSTAQDVYGIFDSDPARQLRHARDHRTHRR